MGLIFRYIWPYRGRMALGISIKLGGTVVELLLPYILAHIIDDVTPLGKIQPVVLWGLLMLVCAFCAILGNVVGNRMAAAVARDTTRTLRHDLFQKISYLSNRQLDGFTIPSLISRMTTDTYNIHRMVGMMQRIGIRAPMLVIGGVLVTLTLDPVLALVLTAMLPIILVIVFLLSRKSLPLFDRLQQSSDRMVRVVRENASGVRVIKALSRSEGEKERFRQVNRQVMADENQANMVMAASKPAMNLTLNLGLVLLMLVGARRVNAGLSGAGTITAFLTYFTIILNAMISITRVLTMWSKALASAGRIQAVMDAPDELACRPPEAQTGEDQPYIVFDRVNFSYGGKAPALRDISFSLARGESLGIIGPTGAGKSTLCALLLRFYDRDSGSIRVDGREVSSWPLEELRAQFGVVLQNDVLFKKSIGENVRMGREISTEEIRRALRDAQADFALESGEDAGLEARGVNLSGGQKQRLLIARALAGRPPVLILDDSSSALDYQTDARLRQALRQEYGETTTILIAQRVSSVKHCDKILVLEEGGVAGLGTHDQLMEGCSLYREISRLQMGEEEAV